MSPIEDGRVIRDKDSFFRDERGLLHMAHLLAFLSSMAGVAFGIVAVVGFFNFIDGWTILVQISFGLLAAGAGLEGGQTIIESRNQRAAK